MPWEFWEGDVQRRPCGEGGTYVPAEGHTESGAGAGGMCAPWKTLLGTLHVHAFPRLSSWSPKLMESLEVSSDQTLAGAEGVDELQGTNVPPLYRGPESSKSPNEETGDV